MSEGLTLEKETGSITVNISGYYFMYSQVGNEKCWSVCETHLFYY